MGGRKTAEFLHKLGVAIVRELVEQWPTEKELQVPSLGKIIKDILEESKAPLATVVVAKQVYDNLKVGITTSISRNLIGNEIITEGDLIL